MVRRSSRLRHLSASNRLLWPVLEAFRFVGRDCDACLSELGLGEDEVYGGTGRVPLASLYDVWRTAVSATGDEALGIRVAAFTDPMSTVSWPMPLSLFEHLGVVSKSLSEAIGLHARFIRLLRDGLSLSLEIDGEAAMFRMDFPEEEPDALVEFSFAMAVNLGRRITRHDTAPREVWFAHRAPSNLRPHAKLFKAPIRYNAPFNGLIGHASDYTRELPTADETFRGRIVRQAELALQRLPAVDLFEDNVCVQIESELPNGNTNAASVAEKLGVSCRTLHRRLQHEGTTYQELLDRVRLRLAARYLSSGRAIGEVATLVGFAQPSTFHRAFKSWTGETPASFQGRSG